MANQLNGHPVTRIIKVSSMSRPDCEQAISKALSALGGVLEVRPDYHKDQVEVVYDLRRIRLERLEEQLVELGYPLRSGFWAGRRRGFAHFKEQNEFDALTHKGHCCSKPPAGA